MAAKPGGRLLLVSLLLPQGSSLLAQDLSVESIRASVADLEGARAVFGVDLDKDGLTDYATAAQTANNLFFFHNTGSGFLRRSIASGFNARPCLRLQWRYLRLRHRC